MSLPECSKCKKAPMVSSNFDHKLMASTSGRAPPKAPKKKSFALFPAEIGATLATTEAIATPENV